MEVPLDRAEAWEALAALVAAVGRSALVGAGTVLEVGQVERVARMGASFAVSPNTDPAVLAEARRLGLWTMPGFFTATEGLAAAAAGADALKLFPAFLAGPRGLAALAAVLPASVPVWAVGGVRPEDVTGWRAAGATGVGVGRGIFRPGAPPGEVEGAARRYLAALS